MSSSESNCTFQGHSDTILLDTYLRTFFLFAKELGANLKKKKLAAELFYS